MAVISPSADMRLSVSSVPASTPRGMAKGKACGSTSANKYATVRGEAGAAHQVFEEVLRQRQEQH